ncbi:MAG: CsgG/HfaB family protein [Kiritimatiellia bacterium]|jgi:curli biogenesis system outer membrane secretion channel CsgG
MKRMHLGMAIVLGLGLMGMAGNAAAAGGNLRYSISVSKFENKSGWAGQWEIGDAFGEIMTAALQESGKFIVLGEKDMRGEALLEQDLAASGRMAGGKKAPKTGQMTPAQLLVKGAITHVQDSTTGGGAGVNVMGFRIGGSGDKAEINATIYIIDSTTGQVKAQTKVVGKAGRKGLNVGYSGAGFGGDVAGFKKDNVGKATEDAVGQGVQFLEKQLEKIPWEGTVLKADDKVTINRGSREGVSVGQVFAVGAVETMTDKDTGEVLDTEMKQAGKIKVTSVKEKISYCEVLSGKIKPDMTIQPAD